MTQKLNDQLEIEEQAIQGSCAVNVSKHFCVGEKHLGCVVYTECHLATVPFTKTSILLQFFISIQFYCVKKLCVGGERILLHGNQAREDNNEKYIDF